MEWKPCSLGLLCNRSLSHQEELFITVPWCQRNLFRALNHARRFSRCSPTSFLGSQGETLGSRLAEKLGSRLFKRMLVTEVKCLEIKIPAPLFSAASESKFSVNKSCLRTQTGNHISESIEVYKSILNNVGLFVCSAGQPCEQKFLGRTAMCWRAGECIEYCKETSQGTFVRRVASLN